MLTGNVSERSLNRSLRNSNRSGYTQCDCQLSFVLQVSGRLLPATDCPTEAFILDMPRGSVGSRPPPFTDCPTTRGCERATCTLLNTLNNRITVSDHRGVNTVQVLCRKGYHVFLGLLTLTCNNSSSTSGSCSIAKVTSQRSYLHTGILCNA